MNRTPVSRFLYSTLVAFDLLGLNADRDWLARGLTDPIAGDCDCSGDADAIDAETALGSGSIIVHKQ